MTTTPARLRFHEVTSADGTRLRAWTNGAEGPAVLLCNGLGTGPHAWPSLLDPGCGVRVVSWNHRGTGGSARSTRIDLDSYLEDAEAVAEHFGIDHAVLASWSTGVTVAFEYAYRFPERVTGILAVAGVPGNTFGTMLAPLHVPPVVARQVMVAIARATRITGYPLAPLFRHFPWTRTTTDLLRRSRFIDPVAETAEVQAMVRDFFTTHPAWYARLAVGVAEHPRVSLSALDVPTTFLAGRRDILSAARDMRSAAERVARSRYRDLGATHFIPVEHPDVVLEELHALVRRAGA